MSKLDDTTATGPLAISMLGRRVRIELDGSEGARVLAHELSMYPTPTSINDADLVFRYGPVPSEGGRRVNPRTHEEYSDGFLAHFTTADVRFRVGNGDLTSVDVHVPPSTRLMSSIRKSLDMQFSTRIERVGMVFHELAFVPAAHWLRDISVVHASALANRAGDVTLIGGTGGVGKTSLMLELCLHGDFDFLADDISFIGEDGWVHPNLAYPKIYAYNLEDNPELAQRVLRGRSFSDRLHWSVHRRRGAQFVRRRLAPDRLFGSFSTSGGRLSRYIVLVREDRPNVTIHQMDAESAAAVSVSVMPPEYSHFYNHLSWHAYHRRLSGKEPSIMPSAVHERWNRLLRSVFEDVQCYMVKVPLSIEHARFKEQMAMRIETDLDAGIE